MVNCSLTSFYRALIEATFVDLFITTHYGSLKKQ